MKIVRYKDTPVATYKEILKNVPIPCVDFIVVHRGAFLLGLRKNKPAQGLWWIPGGRVLKGETQAVAVKRKLKEETGLTAKTAKLVGVFDDMFPDSFFGPSSHSVVSVYKVEPVTIVHLEADSQHGTLRWFKKIDPKWHPYLKEQLRAAGFK